MNMELKFKEQANSIDINNKVMNVLVYKKENDDFICPHCNNKIKLEKIDDIILSNNNIKDTINGIKFNIDNIIRLSTNNTINIQLKNLLKENNEILNNKLNEINNSIKEIKYENGRYVGQVVNGKMEGKGIYYYNDGDRYEGDYKNGEREGKGIYYYNNGDREIGDWKDGKEIGKHVTLTKNGKVETENY